MVTLLFSCFCSDLICCTFLHPKVCAHHSTLHFSQTPDDGPPTQCSLCLTLSNEKNVHILGFCLMKVSV